MNRFVIRNDHRERVKDLLRGISSDYAVTALDNDLFVKAILWIFRACSPEYQESPSGGCHTQSCSVRTDLRSAR